MEGSSMIKGENKDPGFPANSDHSTFHKHDNLIPIQTQLEVSSGIEMIEVVMPLPRVSYSYTSLRDIMPVMPPHHNNSNNSNYNCASWNEIPIKNPLLKQAALAYLQPMSTHSDDAANKGFFRSLKDNCFGWLCGGDGLFTTLSDALLGFFCGTRRRRTIGNAEQEEDQQHHQEEEDDDDDDDDAEEEDNVD